MCKYSLLGLMLSHIFCLNQIEEILQNKDKIQNLINLFSDTKTENFYNHKTSCKSIQE